MRNLAVIRATARKELLELRRDPITLGIAFLLPLVLLFIFGYALTMDIRDVPVAVVDRDRTPESRSYLRRIAQTKEFRLAGYVDGLKAPERLLDEGTAKVAIVVPSGFAEALERGDTASVQTLVDGSFSATAQVVVRYLDALNETFLQDFGNEGRGGYRPSRPTFDIETRVWYNPSLRSTTSLVPGLFAVILMAFPPLLTALAVVREKENGSIRQIYVSPVTPSSFVAGKLIPYVVIAFVDMALVVGVGMEVFRIPLEGEAWFLAGACLLYVFTTVSIGLFVSTVTRTQVVALLLVLVLTVMPSFMFSGFMFPIFNMPPALRAYTYFFPGRYFVELSRGVFLRGTGLETQYQNVVVLGFYGLAMLAGASLRLRRRAY